MRRKRLALIYGGEGEEHEVSLLGAKSLLPHIDPKIYNVLKIKIERSGETVRVSDSGRKTPLSLIKRGKRGGALIGERFYPISLALPLLHGRLGEDGIIQGHLRMLGIPYVGCDTLPGALCFDKRLTKLVARSVGVPVAREVHYKGGDPMQSVIRAEEEIGYPLFVKPCRQGSSVGASLAENRPELLRSIELAIPYSEGGILIEEGIKEKRELEVAYLSVKGMTVVTHPGEIICPGTYGYGEKYHRPTKTEVRARVDVSTAEKLREYTLRLASALEVGTLARFDFFLEGDRILFNEVNTMPGFTDTSLYAAMLAKEGIDRGRLVRLLLESASC